jgi:hypothetical protein
LLLLFLTFQDRLVELALATLERLQQEGPTQAEVDTLL